MGLNRSLGISCHIIPKYFFLVTYQFRCLARSYREAIRASNRHRLCDVVPGFGDTDTHRSNSVPLWYNTSARVILDINSSKLEKGLDQRWNKSSPKVIDFFFYTNNSFETILSLWEDVNLAFCVFSCTCHTF